MSVSMWSYRPEICDGGGCPGDCDLCDKPKNMEDGMSRYIDADNLPRHGNRGGVVYWRDIDAQPTADVRDDATAHKVVGGGEHDGATCWFECDNCGLTVDVSDLFCKHCGARFVP